MAAMLPLRTSTGPRVRLRPALFGLCAAAVLALGGCKPVDEVEAYDAPKPPPPPKREMNRILGAFFAQKDATWSFKLVGPAELVKEQEDAYKKFLQSVRFKDGNPTFDKIEGWVDAPPVQGRFAGFVFGPPDKGLELTINKIEQTGVLDDDQKLADNINRWRQQLDLMKVPAAEAVKESATPAKIDDIKVAMIDLSGYGSGKTSMPVGKPMAGRRPITAPRGETIAYVKPDRWEDILAEEGPRDRRMPTTREAAFRVKETDGEVLITIIPMGRVAGTLEMNVNRWAGEVGLPEMPAAQIRAMTTKVRIAGTDGDYVDLVGPKRERTLAVMLPRPDRTWFIKMKGSADLVAREKARFEGFCQSIRFEGVR